MVGLSKITREEEEWRTPSLVITFLFSLLLIDLKQKINLEPRKRYLIYKRHAQLHRSDMMIASSSSSYRCTPKGTYTHHSQSPKCTFVICVLDNSWNLFALSLSFSTNYQSCLPVHRSIGHTHHTVFFFLFWLDSVSIWKW